MFFFWLLLNTAVSEEWQNSCSSWQDTFTFQTKAEEANQIFKRLFGGVCEKLEKDKDKARLPQSEEVKHFPSWWLQWV